MTVVKICGITRAEDAIACVRAGADWLGLNFWPPSRRFIDAEHGRALAAAARSAGDPALVGVFVNQSNKEIAAVARAVNLDWVQLHGDEGPERCAELVDRGLRVIKALPMASAADIDRLADYPASTFLIDTPTAGYGGSGRTFDWELARRAVATGRTIILAGGLDPDNVAAAVAGVRPFGVDVASGVESLPGIKDHARVRAFIDRAKAGAAHQDHI